MMRKFVPLLALVVLLNLPFLAQSAPPTIYAESFRKGATHIIEESFDVKLNPDNPTYRERIRDSHGNDRYELRITPQVPEGDNKITSWRVFLRDLQHNIYSNVLLENQEPSQDPGNNLSWLNPNQFGPVPILARRIVKVDGFYVAFQVKALHFTPLDSPYLDSMAVHFKVSNSDPRHPAP